MIRQLLRARRNRILIDINTQKDFFTKGGDACVNNHRKVLAHIHRIMALARHNHIPIISICEVQPNNNNNHDDNGGNNHCCIDGTEGQKKIRFTLLKNHITFAADNHADLPLDILRRYRQIILHKRCTDPFDEPRIDRLLSEVKANEFILIGVGAEDAVEATALGLLQRGKKVTVIIDAVGSHDRNKAKLALRKMGAKGAKLLDTKKVAGVSHLNSICNSKRKNNGNGKKSNNNKNNK